VATLLRNMTAPLLYHMSVHRPVCQLITACRAVPEIERSEFVSLLHTLLIKLKKEDPTLVTFFFNEPDTNGSTSEEPQVVHLMVLLNIGRSYFISSRTS
jgi:hypothetical protein